MKEHIEQMKADLARNRAQNDYEVKLLSLLVDLKKKNTTDAEIALDLVDGLEGFKPALEWVMDAKKDLNRMLESMALHVALEGKERQAK